jgi:hypothetical protein
MKKSFGQRTRPSSETTMHRLRQREIRIWAILVVGILQWSTRSVLAQEKVAIDQSLILAIGLAGKWDLNESTSRFGSTVAVEITAIEHWLELEGGVAVLSASGHAELGIDLLFKKPFRLSRTTEIMIGTGPQLVDIVGGNGRSMSYGVEVVLDFLFSPTTNVGWFVEPRYASTFGDRSSRSWGATAGLLIGLQ